MPDILIRDIPEDMKANLAARARRSGRSLSAEIKALLDEALAAPPREATATKGVGTMLSSLVAPEDWTDDFIVPRDKSERPPPDFS